LNMMVRTAFKSEESTQTFNNYEKVKIFLMSEHRGTFRKFSPLRKGKRRCDGRGGRAASHLCVYEPKKTGVHSAEKLSGQKIHYAATYGFGMLQT
jgi:hypothetical protein